MRASPPAVARTRSGVIGVLATGAALAGTKLLKLIDRHRGSVRVITQPCPGLVEQVEAGLGQTADVGHGVVVVLQGRPQGPQLVERQQSRVELGRAHTDPPLTGGSTATSSVDVTAADRSAASPFTQTRQVPSTWASSSAYELAPAW